MTEVKMHFYSFAGDARSEHLHAFLLKIHEYFFFIFTSFLVLLKIYIFLRVAFSRAEVVYFHSV